jgi:hypothetical protein
MSDTGQIAAPIVRYAASSLFRHQTDARRIAGHTGCGEFRACGQKFSCLARICPARTYPGRRTSIAGSDSKRHIQANGAGANASFFAACSIFALDPLSTCASFRAKSSKMSATGHYACSPGTRADCGHCRSPVRTGPRHERCTVVSAVLHLSGCAGRRGFR